MFAQSEIYNALNVSTITGLLDTYESKPALFSDSLIPQKFTGSESINFYIVSPSTLGNDYNEYEYSINCRSSNYTISGSIAGAVIDAINRLNGNGFYIVCELLPTISPADDRDSYNTPVNARIKTR